MLLLFAAAATAAAQPAPAQLGETAWLLATVGQSEWCPAGNVRMDLRTGSYVLTVPARLPKCTDPELERPIRAGTLDPAALAAARDAYLGTIPDGLTDPACKSGRPANLIFDNGGPRILVVANGAAAWSAPDDVSCWSEPAHRLHGLLGKMFRSR